uniref:Uncharacterized protein n=1 Tax=Cannabis sativa TaxID=3483 RepID=A0A803QSL9_CANSA
MRKGDTFEAYERENDPSRCCKQVEDEDLEVKDHEEEHDEYVKHGYYKDRLEEDSEENASVEVVGRDNRANHANAETSAPTKDKGNLKAANASRLRCPSALKGKVVRKGPGVKVPKPKGSKNFPSDFINQDRRTKEHFFENRWSTLDLRSCLDAKYKKAKGEKVRQRGNDLTNYLNDKARKRDHTNSDTERLEKQISSLTKLVRKHSGALSNLKEKDLEPCVRWIMEAPLPEKFQDATDKVV